MKYIKLFENHDRKLVSDIKDYFIDNRSDAAYPFDVYYLFRVEYRNSFSNYLGVTKLYAYNLNNGLEKTENPPYVFLPMESFDIIFQSDNLEEVLEEFMLLVDANKYNL